MLDPPSWWYVPGVTPSIYNSDPESLDAFKLTAELEGILDILENGNGAARQRKVYEANHDFSELVRDLVEASQG